MSTGSKIALAVAAFVAAVAMIVGVLFKRVKKKPPEILVTVEGAVIRQDPDPNKELPLADVDITATDTVSAIHTRSDSTGYFRLTWRETRPGQAMTLRFRDPNYFPLDWPGITGNQIYVARMNPVVQPSASTAPGSDVNVSNIVVRYSVKSTTAVNVGSTARPFQVVNNGNVPCHNRPPCSPDGKWKAATGSLSLDAGEGNEFRNARPGCIAGPCPFTRIESSGLGQDSRYIRVSALNWSDTATFLLEAEIFHPMFSDITRESYPVIFGQALNFTIPSAGEGVTIEADINGAAIVFPLGPDLLLSWATCSATVTPDRTKIYRCELKPGYRFR